MSVVVLTPEEVEKLLERTWERLIRQQSEKEVLTLEEAAALLDLHPKVVTRYIREKSLPAHKIGPEYRFRRSELLAWLDQNRIA
jgi:excisionase family DNA binding protein